VSVKPVHKEVLKGSEATVSCIVGLFSMTRVVADLHWEKEDGTVITSQMTDFEVVEGTYHAQSNTQITTLTVKNGINTVDTAYKCAVGKGEGTKKTSVHLNIFSKYCSEVTRKYLCRLKT
jgi:phosphoenolpyruvate synthase/pyruvate phosphate dikinase